ncbi:MAG TPA: hypothetical protein VN132_06685, partial [Bdellovibrio sp.]|nr:hypothetical protein [Bdellovibrio sp.]
MKKMKVASLALAGMMTVQTTMSYAQVSRVGNIGDKQIAEANQQIANLKMHFESLDKSLFDAAKAIQESEKSGRIPNGAAVIGATIGFAGAAVQLLSKSGEGTLLGAAIAFVGTATSLVTSGLSAALKEDAHTQATESSLAKAQNEVRAAKNSATDAAQAGLLIQLELSL